MKKRHIYLYLFVLALFLPSCRDKDLDMTVMTKTLCEEAVFDVIYAEDAWNVIVVQDDENSFVELEYSAFLDEYLQVGVDCSELRIGFNRYLNLPANTVNKATIHTKSLRSLHLSDAVTAVLDGSFPETSLEMELDDASTCKGGNFTGRAELKLSSASQLVDFYFLGRSCAIDLDDASVFKGWLYVDVDTLDIKLKDASRMTTYGGSVDWVKAEVSSASFLNMSQTYVCGKMHITVKEASEAFITMSGPSFLEGSVTESSSLYYQGYPTLNVDCDDSSTLSPL